MMDAVVFQNISILREMWTFCLRISDFRLGMGWIGNLEKEGNFESSDALSDQVSSLDIVVETEERVAKDLVYRPCWG